MNLECRQRGHGFSQWDVERSGKELSYGRIVYKPLLFPLCHNFPIPVTILAKSTKYHHLSTENICHFVSHPIHSSKPACHRRVVLLFCKEREWHQQRNRTPGPYMRMWHRQEEVTPYHRLSSPHSGQGKDGMGCLAWDSGSRDKVRKNSQIINMGLLLEKSTNSVSAEHQSALSLIE